MKVPGNRSFYYGFLQVYKQNYILIFKKQVYMKDVS